MQKALNSFFGLISAEAERNPAFASDLQDAIIKMAEQFDKANLVQRKVKAFNPFAVFKAEGRPGMTKQLGKESTEVLKLMVKLHNADPTGALGARPKKTELIEAIVSLAEKRAARDAKLFNY